MPDIAILGSDGAMGVEVRNLNNRRLIYVNIYQSSTATDPNPEDWIMKYVNFAYINMAMPGSGMWDTWYDELLKSPANLNYKISSAFGYPCDTDSDPYGGDGLHLLGGHDTSDTENTLENTYIASYYKLASGTVTQTNLKYMVEYIYYLLGETTTNPTKNGKGPSMSAPAGDCTTRIILPKPHRQLLPKTVKNMDRIEARIHCLW